MLTGPKLRLGFRVFKYLETGYVGAHFPAGFSPHDSTELELHIHIVTEERDRERKKEGRAGEGGREGGIERGGSVRGCVCSE